MYESVCDADCILGRHGKTQIGQMNTHSRKVIMTQLMSVKSASRYVLAI